VIDFDRSLAAKILSFGRACRGTDCHDPGMPNAIKKRRRQSEGNSKSSQVRALLATGMSAADIAKKVGCSTNLVYVVKSTSGGAKGKRANGTRLGGRQPNGDSKSGQVRALLATGMSAADIAKKVGCTTGLVYVIKSKMKSGKRGPGRPAKVGSRSGLDGLSGILDTVKNAERERAQLRAALEKIQALLADALA